MRFVGIGAIARRLGISTAAVRYALLNERVPDGSIRGPSGVRLFDDDTADAVVRAYENRARQRVAASAVGERSSE